MVNRKIWKILAILLCICNLAFSVSCPLINTYAADSSGTACITGFPRANDALADYSGTWGRNALNFMNGWACTENVYINMYSMNTHESNICYCIELGTDIRNGYSYTQKDESYWDSYPSKYNKTLSPEEIKEMIGRILYYGYAGKVSTSWVSQNTDGRKNIARAFATQILIWETVVGERDSNFSHVDPAPYSKIINMVKSVNPIKEDIAEQYTEIVSNVQNHLKIASFSQKATADAKTYTLNWDGSKYTRTITDSRNQLSDYTFSCSDSSVKFSISGNNLTITSSKALSGDVLIKAVKKQSRKTVLTWTDGKFLPGEGQQDSVTYGGNISDNLVSYLRVSTPCGNLQIEKISEDGNISNVVFSVKGQGIEKQVKTGTNGKVLLQDLPIGKYVITESADSKYITPASQSVNISDGTTIKVSFNNVLKRGNIKVKKASEDGLIEGLKFHLYGKSQSGENVDEYELTDSNGVATFKDILIGENYKLEEVDTADKYIQPDIQNVKAEWNETLEYSFENIIKKGSVSIEKKDKESGELLSGVQFDIYEDKNANGLYDEDEDTLLGEMTESNEGIYEYTDLKYGSYLIYESASAEGYESEDIYYPFEIKEDGESISLEIYNGKIEETTAPETTTHEETTTKVETTEPESEYTETTTKIYEETTTEKPTEEPTEKYQENPNTGDNGCIYLFCIISLLMASTVILLILKRKDGGHLE